MREIKFRTWDKIKKQMGIVDSISFNVNRTETLVCVTTDKALVIDGVSIGVPRYMDEVELMQYTGLKDKNNKEIYEGDILKDEEHFRWEVVQIGGGWAIECNDMPGMQCLTMTKTEYYKVIGNIYDNPELMQS